MQLEIQDINCYLTQEVELAYSHLSKVCWTTLNTSQPICAHFPCLWNWDDIILADVQKLSSSVLGWQHYRSGTQKNTHMPWLIPCRRNQRVEINLLSIQAPAFEAAVWMSYCFFIWQKLSSLPIPEKVENLNANTTCSQHSVIIWRCSVKCIIRKRFLPPKWLRLNKNVLDKIHIFLQCCTSCDITFSTERISSKPSPARFLTRFISHRSNNTNAWVRLYTDGSAGRSLCLPPLGADVYTSQCHAWDGICSVCGNSQVHHLKRKAEQPCMLFSWKLLLTNSYWCFESPESVLRAWICL